MGGAHYRGNGVQSFFTVREAYEMGNPRVPNGVFAFLPDLVKLLSILQRKDATNISSELFKLGRIQTLRIPTPRDGTVKHLLQSNLRTLFWLGQLQVFMCHAF